MPPDGTLQEDRRNQQEGKTGRNQRNQHGPLDRVTVNLTARGSRALDQAAQITGDTKTDTINRALQVYAYLEEIMQHGGAVYVRESPDSEPQLIKFF